MVYPLGPSHCSDWERDHPRRDEVNDRLRNLNERIDRELKDHDLTECQARQFREEISKIRQEERIMAESDHGHITREEQRALNEQENALRGQIERATETPWEREHPRRDEVNDRLRNLSERIDRELRDGDLTEHQARQFRKEIGEIREEERIMAEFDHGHITRAEQRALNQQENALRRQIERATETPWEREHPRRDEVNDRLRNLSRRIDHELRDGDLTEHQARQFRNEISEIRQEERIMAEFHRGHITREEQSELNRQENELRNRIDRA